MIAAAGDEAGPQEDEWGDGERFRVLVEGIPAIVYVWTVGTDPEVSTLDYISPQVESVLGFGTEEWIADAHLWTEQLHPDDREEVLDETARSAEAGEGFKLEYRMIARDGRVVWLHDVANVLSRDAATGITRYEGVQLDITDRKDSEHAQLRSRYQGAPAGDPGDDVEGLVREDDVLGPLSQREHEVAELLALGHTNAEIAAILHLSVRTIEHHRARVFRKLGVRSRAGLVQALARGPSRPITGD